MRNVYNFANSSNDTVAVISIEEKGPHGHLIPTSNESTAKNRYVRYTLACSTCNGTFTACKRELAKLNKCKACGVALTPMKPVEHLKTYSKGYWWVATAEKISKVTDLTRLSRHTIAVYTPDGFLVPHEVWWNSRLPFALPPNYLEPRSHMPEPDGRGAVNVMPQESPGAVITSAAAKAQVF